MATAKADAQLRKTKVKGKDTWTDASTDAVVAYGETLIAGEHRVKTLAVMDCERVPVLKAAKVKQL